MAGRPAGTVTFLFSDVEGSTEALQRLGESYRAALEAHRRSMRTAIEASGGEIVDARGEEHFAVFGRAHEAVSAAAGAQRSMRGQELKARIGLHTGEPAVDGDGYLGLDVHVAARVCAAGHGGQVLLSPATRTLVPDLDCRDLGEHLLKGIDAPTRIFQLLAPDLPERFPTLRTLAPATRTSALAGVAGRLRRTRRPTYDELSWTVRGQMAAARDPERPQLARLRTALIDANRIAHDVDQYLAASDARALQRQLTEYREMSVVSSRAADEVRRLERGLESLDGLRTARGALDDAVYEVRRLPEQAGAATTAVVRAASRLRAAYVRTTPLIPPMSGKLRRTRHRGVYRLGERYVVPWFDTVGIEHREVFPTPGEAGSFARTVRLREKSQTDFTGGLVTRYDQGDR